MSVAVHSMSPEESIPEEILQPPVETPPVEPLLVGAPPVQAPPVSPPGKYWAPMLVVLFLALFSWHNAAWLARDDYPLYYDSAKHFSLSLKASFFLNHESRLPLVGVPEPGKRPALLAPWLQHYDTAVAWLENHPTARYLLLTPWNEALAVLRSVFMVKGYPFANYLIPAYFYQEIPVTPDHAILVYNTLFLTLGAVAVYFLASRWAFPAAGALAAFLLLVCPMVQGLSKQYFTDISLLVSVGVAWAAWFACDGFRLRRPSLWFGVTLGCGMLCKQTFFIFLTPAFLVELPSLLRGREPERWGNLARTLLLATSVAATFYLPFGPAVVSRYFWWQTGENGVTEAGGTGAWRVTRYFLDTIVNVHLSAPLALLVLVGVLVFLVTSRRHRFLVLLAWTLPTAFFVTHSNALDARYVLPLLPLLVTVGAVGVARLLKACRWGWLLVGPLLAGGLLQPLYLHWLAPPPGKFSPEGTRLSWVEKHLETRYLHEYNLFNRSAWYAFPCRPDVWRTAELYGWLVRHAAPAGVTRVWVIEGQPDEVSKAMTWRAMSQQLSYRHGGISWTLAVETPRKKDLEVMDQVDLFLVLEGEVKYLPKTREVFDAFTRRRDDFVPVESRVLDNGVKATLSRRKAGEVSL